MSTIGVKDIIPKGVVAVIWSWTDDEVQLHNKKLNNVLYFPDLKVNILSANALAESIKCDEVTWELTKWKYSIFTSYFVKYKKTIAHS